MAFDAALHAIDPVTGFMVHKDSGAIAGVEQHSPVKSKAEEWPKWVPVHGSHLNGDVAPEFGQSFRPRGSDAVMVLVDSEEEAARATAEKKVDTHADDHDPQPHDDHLEPRDEPLITDRPVPGFPASGFRTDDPLTIGASAAPVAPSPHIDP